MTTDSGKMTLDQVRSRLGTHLLHHNQPTWTELDMWRQAIDSHPPLNTSIEVETLKALVERWRDNERHNHGCGDFCDGVAHGYDMSADELAAAIKRGEVGGD